MRLTNHLLTTPLLLLTLAAMVLLSSCEKKEVVVIDNNIAPPDSTIENVVYEQYVNRTYIALTGQEPDEAQRNAALQILYSNGLGINSRNTFIDQIQQTTAFKTNLFTIANDQLLNGYDSLYLVSDLFVLYSALQDSQYIQFWPQLQEAYDDLVRLLNVPAKITDGTIDQKEMYYRMVDSAPYDEINMGTENFVLSIFDHFMLRYPTAAELTEGKNMVDGLNAVIFLHEGESKEEFMDIFFSSDEYYQGQVISLFRRFLFRDPTSEEASDLTAYYKGTQNYNGLMKKIITTDEYVGL